MAQNSVCACDTPSTVFANHHLVRRNAFPPHSSQPKARCSKYAHIVARDWRHCSHVGLNLDELLAEPQQHAARIERVDRRELCQWQEREWNTQRRGHRKPGVVIPESSRQSGGRAGQGR
jgi:hypothetical protein